MNIFDKSLQRDFETKMFYVELSNNTRYRTKFNIESVQISMSCGYNTRSKTRWIVLTDRNVETLLSQTFLKSKQICELNFYANVVGLRYSLALIPKVGNKDFKEYNYINWADDFSLAFSGHSTELEERLQNNILYNLVSD